MERQPLTPNSAREVQLPSWFHLSQRDAVIREHFRALGIATLPRRDGWYLFRSELVAGVQAHYDHSKNTQVPRDTTTSTDTAATVILPKEGTLSSLTTNVRPQGENNGQNF